MSWKIRIQNSGEQFYVDAGESIMGAARRQHVKLPYACDDGTCGTCIYTIIEGAVEYPDGRPIALLDEDLKAGKGLCCVGHPVSDMLIELEEPGEDVEPWS